MAIRNIVFYTIFLIVLPLNVQSQNIVHYNGQNFEELSMNGAHMLFMDRKGFLWIGTNNGVARYDGYTYAYYKENPLDTVGFQGHVVYSMLEDHRGGIWVGSEHGVNYLAPGTTQFIHYHIDNGFILSMVEDKDSTLWMTNNVSLMKLSNKPDTGITIETYRPKDDKIRLSQLIITDDCKLLSTGNGAYELDVSKDDLTVVTLIKERTVNAIAQIKDGTLLIASDSGYFVKQPGKEIIEKKVNRQTSQPRRLHIDKSGTIWLAYRWGIGRVKLNTEYDIVEANIYQSGFIHSIVEDPSGNLFFGTNNGFLKLAWNNNQYNFISLPQGFEKSYAFNFVEDDEGLLWVGTFDGLLTYHPKEKYFDIYREDLRNLKSIPHRSIYSLFKDSKNSIWVATENGVVKYDAASKQFLQVPVGGLSHHLCEDKDGLIWFVSEDKLYSFDPEKWKINQIEFIDGKKVVANQIFIDRENTLWVTSRQEGLQDYVIDSGNLKVRGEILLPVQSGNNEARVLTDDNLGRLWVNYTFGVYIIDKKTRKVVHFMNTNNSPLLVDDAFGIVRDKAGYIWLKQHPFGSMCIDPKTFNAVAHLPNWLFGGMKGERNRFEPVSVTASSADGKLFTDGYGDFCYFYPDSLRINKIPPTLVLHEFKINGTVYGDNERFQSEENNAEFIFSALHFDNPQLNQYAYFLKGFDADWSSPTRNREARYSSLPSGNYEFYLKASNSDGIWSEPKRLASFTVLPVWWQTYTAYAVYIIIIAGLIILFYRIRVAQKLAYAEAEKFKEIDDFKNQFFTNITHEFRTPLTVITGVAERIEGQPGILIKRNAEQLLALINQILELSKIEANAAKLNPEPVDIIKYVKYLLQSFTSLADEKSIALHLHADTDPLTTVLDKTKFTLIIQNLVTNAVKFTPKEGSITISIALKENNFEIEVRDTGVGIDSAALPFIFNRFYQADNQQDDFEGTGIGLALTKELVELMNGDIEVESKKGSGSRFIVSLPIQRQAIRSEIQPSVKDEEIATANGAEKLSILLIEDNEDVADVIRGILSEKFEVYHAVNGRQGVEKAIDTIPDIIISDVMMPEMNGLEATQLLKSDSRTSHIPIILLTAKVDIDSRLSGLAQGADIYLAKPFHSKELLLHIQNLMRLRDSLRLRYAGEQALSKESQHPEDKFVVKLQTLIYDYLSDDNFGIDEVCKEMGVSRTQLHRKLKALTGKSASIYIRDLRLAEGKKLLLQNTTTVAEVAYAVGFSDPNYFSRLYSEKYGHSPIQERKN